MNFFFRRFLILSSLFLLSINACFFAQTNSDPAKVLPESIDGWKTLTADRTFNEETLYDYIDGGAELFRSFGFSKVFNRIYSKDNGNEIIVDIFYMNTSYNAFGVFSHSVGKIGTDYGQQSQLSNGAILFWKNNFYISILCNPATEESKPVITKIAALLDKSILSKGDFPEVLKYLPLESLINESIRYFRHYIWLNTYCSISTENILNINQKTHGVLAQYGGKENRSVLLLIEYPSNAVADSAKKKFVKNYNSNLANEPILQTEKNKWTGIELVNNFFVGIFNAGKKETVIKLLDSTKKSIIKKNHK